ncbi:MAG: glycoside hydrolase family 125 protein [Candidatus Sumerlaeaceae bacterium]
MHPIPEPFHSHAVERAVRKISDSIEDNELRATFLSCATRTLRTSVLFHNHPHAPDTFIVSGDAQAMSLRDSAAQVHAYIRFLGEDEQLAKMVQGLVRRHLRSILIDPYADAFTYTPISQTEHSADLTTMKPGVFERKYAIDSLCYTLRLVFSYWSATGDAEVLDDEWQRAMRRVVEIWRLEQNHASDSGYRFQRLHCPDTDTLSHSGLGSPVAFTGMSWSGFRPGNTRCEYHCNIPGQAFATVALSHLADLAVTRSLSQLAEEAYALQADIGSGIEKFGKRIHPQTGESVYAYEVDGLGNATFLDDPTPPSLLSLPYLGFCQPDDPVYCATRSSCLTRWFTASSERPPEQLTGAAQAATSTEYPMAMIMCALTSTSQAEIHHCLAALLNNNPGARQVIHSEAGNDGHEFARPWTPTATSLFGELIFHLAEHWPQVLVDFRSPRPGD